MRFCVRTIEHDPRLCADGGLLRGADLTLAASAQALAERLREDAKLEAQHLLDHARSEAKDIVAAAERDVWARAASLLQALERQHAMFLEHAQGVVIDLSQSVFERLVAEASDAERVAACVRRVLQDAPKNLPNALLRVHPDDVAHLPPVEWEIEEDAAMARGACRLEASSGEWHADFIGAAAALRSALESFRLPSGPTASDAREEPQ